ncbi:MAG: glycerol-3-phosphate dehydrogenase [Phaeovulum sp.]|uniref:glycerol-3-phosphate dehydrogenase n=1 Tax=Phaeovulum sp. TaxID=2934796 RepID=UPI00272FA8C0|nr:glycerol-3-phosphate dehydrogenase [Phaeovulum sp.]MDP2064309.1 glycerol-3-phosphate dehydrogenase [Phaeovulum sp.]
MSAAPYDIFIIGGGVNGCGIARDAAGRGLRVALAEMGDLAQGTSSASTKLFHGGLRYLEFLELRLVHEALTEREVLLVAMPHIARPMRFVLPTHPMMRFAGGTPISTLLGLTMPWMRGRRPAWVIRAGLFLYDHMGGRKILPGTRKIDLHSDPAGAVLNPKFTDAFEYSDCWVDDSRLVVLNARDAAARGAQVMVRARVVHAEREGNHWRIVTEGEAGRQEHLARALVNAAGPWVAEVMGSALGVRSGEGVRLVRGSHIVTRRLFDHNRAYFFQGEDGRIVFALPFEQDFTLIGTTDLDHQGDPGEAVCTDAEQDYLCAFASKYFAQPVTRAQIVWTYSGVRPLYDDGAKSATQATRDYVLSLDAGPGAPLLEVFGGKITTYRKLAEAALAKIAPGLGGIADNWTARVPLPGGDFPHDGVAALTGALIADYPFLTPAWAARLVHAYGTEARRILAGAKTAAALGRDFGGSLTEAELRWLMAEEFARSAEDVLWRRSKLGLRLDTGQVAALAEFMGAV